MTNVDPDPDPIPDSLVAFHYKVLSVYSPEASCRENEELEWKLNNLGAQGYEVKAVIAGRPATLILAKCILKA